MINIYNHNYLILVDESGRAYIAHADKGYGNAVRGRAWKKYYMRIGGFPNYRYFYSAQEYNRYLQNQREQYMIKTNALEKKRRIAEQATVFGNKNLRSNMKKAKKEYFKADDAWRKLMNEDKNHPEEYKKAEAEYESARKKYEDAKELYNLSRKIDNLPANLQKRIEKSIKDFSEDPDKTLRIVRKILRLVG